MNKMTFSLVLTMLGLIFISAISVVYSQHKNRQLFVNMQTLMKQKDQLNIQYGRLQLEQSAWASYGRIEKKAINELAMRAPDINDLQFILLDTNK